MELQITGKNTEVLPAVHSYIDRKMGKLNRRLPNIMESKVEITEEKTKSPQQRFVVQITVNSNGTLLRGEDRGEDMLAAIDKVVAIMNRQIERYKGRLYKKGRGTSLARGQLKEELEQPSQVVKVKRFNVKQMSVDEAIAQMELLGHDFFLFFNLDTAGFSIVYRRNDGGYGLIEPRMEQ